MAQIEVQPHDPAKGEPWRCDACGKLIYNSDQAGRPFDGAPGCHWGNVDYKQICSMCHGMLMVIDQKDYFRHHHREWKTNQEARQAALKKMKDDNPFMEGSA